MHEPHLYTVKVFSCSIFLQISHVHIERRAGTRRPPRSASYAGRPLPENDAGKKKLA